MIETYTLDVHRGHRLIHVSGGVALLDTGSPFTLGRREPLVVNGQRVRLHDPGSVLEIASKHLERPIDWLLGGDVLSSQRVLLDDTAARCVCSSEVIPLEGGQTVPINLARGIPVLAVQFREMFIDAVLDSGAWLSYVPTEVVENVPVLRTEQDYHPMCGPFSTGVWRVPFRVGTREIIFEAGVLPPVLRKAFGTTGNWILGSDFFHHRRVLLDYPNGCIVDAPG